jgi:secreted PhoX family phosphatase
VRLHLPEGFAYRSFHDTEQPITLDDGTLLPGRHDGMGAFAGPGGLVTLIRNHEVNNPGPAFGPVGDHTYDPMARGGCTHVDVTNRGEVRAAYTAINGTMMNCSGGQMPWGAWVTCEETVNGPDVGPDFTGASNVPLTKPHGYVFEVPVDGRASGEPLTRAGRFAHEAVSFDPREGRLYLTEDNFAFPSGFYRYTPSTNPMETGHLANDGRLQMLAVKGQPNAHLEAHQPKGATYAVEWVDIDDPDPTYPYTPGQTAPTPNDTAIVHVGDQGRAKGAAGFSRLEGQVYKNGVVYFTSTQGGGAAMTGPDSSAGYGRGFGQVWAYDTRSEKLRLVYESPGKQTFDFPDNITVSKRGTLVVCEDNNQDNYVRGLNRGGQLWDIALNRVESSRTGQPRYDDEFAGSTFSPDGSTLFVNIQASAGLTFAIWGKWERMGV